MSITTVSPATQAPNDTSHTLISINTAAQAPLKLNSSNYLSWKLQFQTLFVGYDLLGYIDGTKPCPPATITQADATIPNPAHHLWTRQDQLILNAIIGSITPSIIPFIAQAETSKQAWTTLANTYAKPSRGRIKQLKIQLKNITKGTLGISEFMQLVKTKADDLALLGAPIDDEELTDKILEGLNDDYKELVRAVQARDITISFEELHEKLLNFEASLQSQTETHFPASAHLTYRNTNRPWRSTPPNNRYPPNHNHPWRQSMPSPATHGRSQFSRLSSASSFLDHVHFLQNYLD